jgi:uncharacterized protein
MDAALGLSALLMGLAGTPHCLAMCAPACGAVARGCGGARPGRAMFTMQAGRLASYAAGGAVVAGSMSALAQWAPGVAWLRPLWLMLHLAALLVGLAMLVSARQPAWLGVVGRGSVQVVALPRNGVAARRAGLPHATLAGLLWVAWPCGLLQSALLVAALASGPAAGAAVMAAFALGSGAGLVAGPALWARLAGGRAAPARWHAASVRLAGAMLAAASLWALLPGMASGVALFCAPG